MRRNSTTAIALPPVGRSAVGEAWNVVSASFDRLCLAAGIEALGTMLERDAEEACGRRDARGAGRRGHRWGRAQGKIGFHGGRVELERARVRGPFGRIAFDDPLIQRSLLQPTRHLLLHGDRLRHSSLCIVFSWSAPNAAPRPTRSSGMARYTTMVQYSG